ncbi:hypothetical protein GRAN_4938 [Granulicella sibirica]|uniref:Uncharacterized protein n=1 Tax=Granulicella sibirica TaxID=2479048 RepID=A0A4Q0SX02_9BACT|nr:hypothetical protein GRAN_4938 [Granulicella sibirica]
MMVGQQVKDLILREDRYVFIHGPIFEAEYQPRCYLAPADDLS